MWVNKSFEVGTSKSGIRCNIENQKNGSLIRTKINGNKDAQAWSLKVDSYYKPEAWVFKERMRRKRRKDSQTARRK